MAAEGEKVIFFTSVDTLKLPHGSKMSLPMFVQATLSSVNHKLSPNKLNKDMKTVVQPAEKKQLSGLGVMREGNGAGKKDQITLYACMELSNINDF